MSMEFKKLVFCNDLLTIIEHYHSLLGDLPLIAIAAWISIIERKYNKLIHLQQKSDLCCNKHNPKHVLIHNAAMSVYNNIQYRALRYITAYHTTNSTVATGCNTPLDC